LSAVWLLFWPMVGVSLILAVAAVVVRSWKLAVASAVAALPFMLYLCLTPFGRGIGPLVIAAHVGSAWALSRGHRLGAALLLLPFVCLALYAAAVVASQWR